MNFLVGVATVIILLHFVHNKAIDKDDVELVSDSRHFGKISDYENVKIPSKKDFSNDANKHPYNFYLTNDGSGNYSFSFETLGLQRYEIGEIKNAGTENEAQVVRGQYSERYGDDMNYIIRTIGYIADENGYRPFLININSALSQPQGVPEPTPSEPAGPKTGTASLLESLIMETFSLDLNVGISLSHSVLDDKEDTLFRIPADDFDEPGAPKGPKTEISSPTLGSLIGGNFVG